MLSLNVSKKLSDKKTNPVYDKEYGEIDLSDISSKNYFVHTEGDFTCFKIDNIEKKDINKIKFYQGNKSDFTNEINLTANPEGMIEKDETIPSEENSENELSDIDSLITYTKLILKILNSNNMRNFIASSEVVRKLLISVRDKIDYLLTTKDDLGLPLNALEIEVADMVKQKNRSEEIPPYDRHAHETPLKYLEKYYGKYLLCFGAEDDYLYQFQLEAIDPKFRNNLKNWLTRHGENINDYIPTKSVKLDKQALALKENPETKRFNATDLMVKFYKMDSLRKTNRL